MTPEQAQRIRETKACPAHAVAHSCAGGDWSRYSCRAITHADECNPCLAFVVAAALPDEPPDEPPPTCTASGHPVATVSASSASMLFACPVCAAMVECPRGVYQTHAYRAGPALPDEPTVEALRQCSEALEVCVLALKDLSVYVTNRTMQGLADASIYACNDAREAARAALRGAKEGT